MENSPSSHQLEAESVLVAPSFDCEMASSSICLPAHRPAEMLDSTVPMRMQAQVRTLMIVMIVMMATMILTTETLL